MKKLKIIFALILVIIFIPIINVSAMQKCKQDKKIILIDPGHGGVDGGAKSPNGTIEKDINLSISLKLKKALKKEGYKVYLTRENDKSLCEGKRADLEARCNMKKETKCDVFISIHQNKFSSAKCFGAQVWYANNEKSNKMATILQDSLKNNINDNNKRVAKPAQDLYKILRDGYDGACVIVECGFLSNYEEEQKLKTDEHQNKIVKGIKEGINKYFDK